MLDNLIHQRFNKSRIVILFFLLLVINSGTNIDKTAAYVVNHVEYSQLQVTDEEISTNILGAEAIITNTPEAFEGYNLFVLLKVDTVTLNRQLVMLIVDMNGEVILEENLGENLLVADCPAEFLDPTTILVRKDSSAAIYNLTDGSFSQLPFDGHHELEYNPIDDTFFTFHYDQVEVEGETYLYDKLIEFDRQGNIVWSFDVSSLIGVNQSCPYQDSYLGYPDISHSNTIYYDVENDSIYLNLRNANTFWKIDHSSGDAIWGLGEYGNFSLYNKLGQPADNLFFHAHAVERVDEETFILFDNDYHNQTLEYNRVSRIVEITIDEASMTANVSWVWASEAEYSSHIWGDADRLPNGNRLGVFGVGYRASTPYGGRLVEVNEEHEIVWEMSFVSNETYRYGIYRNERFQFQPILQVLDADREYSEGNVSINWQAWFNYRPKRDVQGSFELFMDDVLIQDGEITFDRYWRPASLSYTFQDLLAGTYNATLVVWDGYGNSAKIMAEVNVTSVLTLLLVTGIIIGVVALIIVWKKYQSTRRRNHSLP